MNRNILKIIALLTMTLDHIALFLIEPAFLPEIYFYLRILGRVSFPLFALFISEGYIHTHNFKRYFKNLLLLALALEFFLLLFAVFTTINVSIFSNTPYNIIWTFINALIFMKILNMKKICLYPILFILAFLSNFLPYGIYGFLIIVLFSIFKNNKHRAIIHFLILFSYIFLFAYFLEVFYSLQMFAILASPLIFIYNGKSKKSGKKIFYHYYLFHTIFLILLSLFL